MTKKINASLLVWRIEKIKEWAERIKTSEGEASKDICYKEVINYADKVIKMLLPDEIEITEDNET